MTRERLIFGSLALDLKRVAVGYHRGSNTMADRFMKEVQKRIVEAQTCAVKPYMRRHLIKIERIKRAADRETMAEQALTYSIITQNYCMKYC